MDKLIYILLLFVISCTTQKKCYEKFPPKPISSISDTIYTDTAIYVTDTIKLPEISFSTGYIEVKDTVILNDTVRVVIKTKRDKVQIECNVKELQYVIDSLKVKFQKMLIEKKQIEQVYYDQKLELKKIKAEKKPLIQQAKAEKWGNISKAVGNTSKYIMWILLVIAGIILLKSVINRK